MRILMAAVALTAGALAQTAPVNLDFEAGTVGQAPSGWRVAANGGAVVADRNCPQGSKCVVLSGSDVNLYETVTPDPYLSFLDRLRAALRPAAGPRNMRFRAAVRVEGAGARVRMWLRVEGKGGSTWFQNSPEIAANGWNYYHIDTNLGPDARQIGFGFVLSGSGKAWVDDASFAEAPAERRPAPRRSTGRVLMAYTPMSSYQSSGLAWIKSVMS